MTNDQLRKLQMIELEILIYLHKFCEKNNIKYVLTGGTALGAVRHKGFIPWDDDIDICVSREDFDSFEEKWNMSEHGDLVLQMPSLENHITHIKIRKRGTIYATNDELKKGGECGVWVDVFPFDKIPSQRRARKRVLTSALMRLFYIRNAIPKNKGFFKKVLSAIMLLIPKRIQKHIIKSCEKRIFKYKSISKEYDYFSLNFSGDLKKPFAPNLFNDRETIIFEGQFFYITKDWDLMLKTIYGDYMTLPPEEKRICEHSPDCVRL